MLGQFFGSRKGTGAAHAAPGPTLDSATEESHTRHLLFPDANTLYHPEGQPYPLHGVSLAQGSGFDGPLAEIDLEFPKDCRIIIAQDESGPLPKTILYDSKPTPPRTDSPTQSTPRSRVLPGSGAINTTGPAFGGMHARRSSLNTESTPRSPTVGAFTRSRTRGNSISSMPNIDEHSQTQAKAKEANDLASTCLECMFGNTALNYRGNTIKMHIIPLDSRTPESNSSIPVIRDGTNSLGRSDGIRRRSHLATSFTPSNLPAELPRSSSTEAAETPLKEPRRRTILITRLFSVVMPDENTDAALPTPKGSVGKGNGFPFPPRQNPLRRTPMYAITIILHLPLTPSSAAARPFSRTGPHNSKVGPFSTSLPGHDSLGSSLDSDRRGGWAFVDSASGFESLMSASLSSDVDDRVEVVSQHWDVVLRTLSSLQFVVQERILAQFKQMQDNNVQPPLQNPRFQQGRSTTRDPPMQLPRRALRLQPSALAFDKEVKQAVEFAGYRLVSGMRIPRVVTGQGRWGVWREEARWLGRWAGGRDQNFFFFNLLTAFLGSHTEWLNLLGPKWHRKRHRDQHKSTPGENMLMPNRTIIISPDKMAARRLIFLLAAFLPSGTTALYDGASPMRPSTAASLRAYSQSPPTNIPPSRKHSLRRQINRRPRGKPSLTNMRLQPPAVTAASLSTVESANGRSDAGVADLPEAPRHSRRSSAHSIRSSLVLPSMSENAATHASTATTSTAKPQNAATVAHFTLPRTKSSGPMPEYRPDSGESLASANLMHNLRRSGTGHTSNPSTDSGTTSRWGSLIGSFWSGRRESSTGYSDTTQTTDDGVRVPGPAWRSSDRSRSQLEQMVQELSMDQDLFGDGVDVFEPPTADSVTTADSSPETHASGGSSGITPSAARPIPERPKQLDTGLKLSVNEKDGVIDVDIPLPDFGSPLQSPLMGGYSSAHSQGSSLGETSILSMPYIEPEQPVNAAGWLTYFHPDFAVQAVMPYDKLKDRKPEDLELEIRRAMSSESTPIPSAATPTVEQGPLQRWIDVCSALVADTRNFSVKRIKLRRLVKLIPTPAYHQATLTPGIAGMPGRSQWGNPYTPASSAPTMAEVHLKDEFIEEPIMDFDPTLIDALDRVLAQSGQPSRVQSVSSSRSSSRRGRRDTRSGSDVSPGAEVAQTECKSIIFEALEAVVKNVTAERSAKDALRQEVTNTQKANEHAVKTATDSSLKEGIRKWLVEVE